MSTTGLGSSGGSASSGCSSGPSNPDCDDECMTAEEVGKALGLSESVVDWLKTVSFDKDDPILVLDYRNEFFALGGFEENKRLVKGKMVLGRGEVVVGAENLIKFANWKTLYDARRAMLDDPALTRYFYSPIERVANRNDVGRVPKISTSVICSYTGRGLNLQEYQFFEL